MKSAILFSLLAPVLFATQLLPVSAKPTSHTTYSYYSVSGGSLQELHRYMLRKAPTANGVKAYGIIAVSPGKQMSLASCKKNGRYHFDLSFVIQLPRAVNTNALSATEIKLWKQFIQLVKNHEETHRSIWMEYAAKFDQKLQAIRFQDCNSAHAKAMMLWKKMLADCNQRQIAFDRQERGHLRINSFIKVVAK
jgi:predicted secreted Zn-dependent protease